MSQLHKHDLSVAPLYLMRGRKPKEQLFLLYMWATNLAGGEWTFSDMTTLCGLGVNRVLAEQMVREGLLLLTDEAGRPNGKPCHMYAVNAAFIPEHAAPKEKTRKKAEFERWAIEAHNIWKPKGIISPLQMQKELGLVVREMGSAKMLEAFVRYVKKGEEFGDMSPRRFAQHIGKWLKKNVEYREGPSMADM